MTIINCNSNDIKVSQTNRDIDSFIAHNFQDESLQRGDNFDCSGYPAIVRQFTPSQWERHSQPKISDTYPIFIPGIGREQCEDSKNVIGAARCGDCGTVEIRVEHCESWECPVCGQRKVRRQARNIVQRLNGFKEAVETKANPRHIVLSSERFKGMSLTQITKSMNNLFARHLREFSGVYVIHPFRIRGWDDAKRCGAALYGSDENIKRRLREYREKAKRDNICCPGDFWTMVKQDVLGLGSWREYVYESPHIHILGWGYLPNSKKFYEETGGAEKCGFVYKTKEREGRSFDFYQGEDTFGFTSDILRTLNYLGSHAAIMDTDGEERHANRIFRPFGFCSVRKLRVVEKECDEGEKKRNRVLDIVIKEVHCPACNSLNCQTTRLMYGYYKADKFDEGYNPIDEEGRIVGELIEPLHEFKWRWYEYQFVGFGVREEALSFAYRRLPRRSVRESAGASNSFGLNLSDRIERLMAEYDKWSDNNSDDGVIIDV